MVKKVPVGHWECEYCGAGYESKSQAEDHEKDCEYRYDKYD